MIRTLAPRWHSWFLCCGQWPVSWGESAIPTSLRPRSILLFPGPFSRRELLLYKLTQSIRGNIATGTLFGLFAARHAPLLAGGLGWAPVLTLMFWNVLTLTLTLLEQVVSQGAYSLMRRMALILVTILAGLGLAATLKDFDQHNVIASLGRFRGSLAGSTLLARVRGFSTDRDCPRCHGTYAMDHGGVRDGRGALRSGDQLGCELFGGGPGHQPAGLCAASTTQAVRRRCARGSFDSRRSAHPHSLAALAVGRWAKCVATMAAACPPIARAHATTSDCRGDGRRTFAGRRIVRRTIAIPCKSNGGSGGGLAYQSLLASIQLPAGFRGDLDRMDWLKSLPMEHPTAVVCGQVAGPALLLSLVQSMLMLVAWAYLGGRRSDLACKWIVDAGTHEPVALLCGGESRVSDISDADEHCHGRRFSIHEARFMRLLEDAQHAAARRWPGGRCTAGAIVYLVIPQLWLAIGCCLWCWLVLINTFIVFLATQAFLRFDISQDTPPA